MSKESMNLVILAFVSWSFGWFGADRFYRGQIGLGILKLITFGGFGLWWIIDALIATYQLGQSMGNGK